MALKVADDVIAEMDMGKDRKSLDPALLSVLVTVISDVVVYIVKNCILNKKIASTPNFIQKAQLGLLVHRYGREQKLTREQRNDVYNGLLKKGSKATDEDIQEILTEVGKTN